MTRKGEQRFEPRLILRLAVDVLAQLVEHQVIAHAPRTSLAHGDREIHVAQYAVVARGEEVGVHIGEVLVAAVEELGVVAHTAESAGDGGENARLGRHFHHTRIGKRGVAREGANGAAVGAETVGVAVGEEHPFASQAVEMRSDLCVAFGATHHASAATLHEDEQNVGAAGVEQAVGRRQFALGVIIQRGEYLIGFIG